MTKTPDLFDFDPPLARALEHCRRLFGSADDALVRKENPIPPRPLDLGHAGAEQAADHADAVNEGSWRDIALRCADSFLAQRDKPFIMAELVTFAEASGCPLAPDRRAWGSIALHLSRHKRMVPTGQFVEGPRSQHGCPIREWRKA